MLQCIAHVPPFPPPPGLSHLDLDMHHDPAAWGRKVAALRALLRSRLTSAAIHVNSAGVTPGMLCQNLALLRHLPAITVRP